MMERSNLVMRGRSEQTKRRHQIDVLLKKAMKGDRRAKLKVYKEFGIRVYSSSEVEKYVQERVSQEYVSDGKNTSNGPTVLTRETEPKGLSKNGAKRSRSKSSFSRGRSRAKTKQLIKKV
ncbi:MAG: hypothetical protein KAW16_06740 [candidate division Zixibacteria bacterium]|nr:hypothetical protein [candidate division Zixibacteria bacterium]